MTASKGVKLPQVGIYAEAEKYDSLPPNKAKILGGGTTDVYGAINLNMLLFSNGRAEANIDSTSAAYYAAVQDLRRIRQDVMFAVSKAYYKVLKSQAILESREDAVKQIEQHLKVAQEKFDVGKASKIDVLRAEVQSADVRQIRQLATDQLDIAEQELLNEMGLGLTSEQINPVKDTTPAQSYNDSKNFIEEALKMHPDYLKANLITRIAESNIRYAKAEYGPNISLVTSYNREGSNMPEILNWNAGLILTLPIYTGGITQAKVVQAKAAAEQAKSNTNLVKQNIILAVRSAVLSTFDAASRLQVMQKSVEQAREALNIAQEKYNNGLGSTTEVIDTQTALTQAETSYAQTLYDGKTAGAELYYAIGRDPDITGKMPADMEGKKQK